MKNSYVFITLICESVYEHEPPKKLPLLSVVPGCQENDRLLLSGPTSHHKVVAHAGRILQRAALPLKAWSLLSKLLLRLLLLKLGFYQSFYPYFTS